MGHENAASSGLSDRPIRWIVDDCKSSCSARSAVTQVRRDHYGSAELRPRPSGETEDRGGRGRLFIDLTIVLSDKPLFVLISSYSTGLGAVRNELSARHHRRQNAPPARLRRRELGLPVESTGLVLPCGSSARSFYRRGIKQN